MQRSFQLFLPALLPSWRFFDWIAPSPRIEVVWREEADDASGIWREFRPRPKRVSLAKMLKRLFWNPEWNETLFLVSCAERLMEAATEHSHQEILNCIIAEVPGNPIKTHVQFRLVFVSRTGAQLDREITYISPVFDLRTAAP